MKKTREKLKQKIDPLAKKILEICKECKSLATIRNELKATYKNIGPMINQLEEDGSIECIEMPEKGKIKKRTEPSEYLVRIKNTCYKTTKKGVDKII